MAKVRYFYKGHNKKGNEIFLVFDYEVRLYKVYEEREKYVGFFASPKNGMAKSLFLLGKSKSSKEAGALFEKKANHPEKKRYRLY